MPHVPQQLAIEPAFPCVQAGHRPGLALRPTLATAADWPDGNRRGEGDPRQRYTQALLHFWSAIASLRRGRARARAHGRPLRRARCLAPCHTPTGCFNQRSRITRSMAFGLSVAGASTCVRTSRHWAMDFTTPMPSRRAVAGRYCSFSRHTRMARARESTTTSRQCSWRSSITKLRPRAAAI